MANSTVSTSSGDIKTLPTGSLMAPVLTGAYRGATVYYAMFLWSCVQVAITIYEYLCHHSIYYT